jgi:hypothetical protein
MELYECRDADTRLGRIARKYGGLLLLVTVVVGIVGVVSVLYPHATAAWRAFGAPLLEGIRLAVGV